MLSSNRSLAGTDKGLDNCLSAIKSLGMKLNLSIGSDGLTLLEYFNQKAYELQHALIEIEEEKQIQGLVKFLNYTSLPFGTIADWENIKTKKELLDFIEKDLKTKDFVLYCLNNKDMPNAIESAYIKELADRWGLSKTDVNSILKNEITDIANGPLECNSYDTFYKAKGLEYKNVVVLITSSGTLFSSRFGLTSAEEVEKDFYTMITRAKNNLLVICLEDTSYCATRSEEITARNKFRQLPELTLIKHWCEENLSSFKT